MILFYSERAKQARIFFAKVLQSKRLRGINNRAPPPKKKQQKTNKKQKKNKQTNNDNILLRGNLLVKFFRAKG